MKTIKDFCDALTTAFGEEYPLESVDTDKLESFMGDNRMGYFKVTSFKILIALKRVEKITKDDEI